MIEQLSYYLGRFAENPANHIIDIILVSLAIYGILMLIRGTRAVPLLRGVIFLVILLAIVSVTVIDLTASRWLIRNILPALLVAIPVIFQPELRRALEQLGRAGSYFRLFRKEVDTTLVDAISTACQQ
ncbi:MAG: TIGR00159 family protein, partial [Chloroflexota bacterium]